MNITILNNGSEPLYIRHSSEKTGGVFPLNPGKFATVECDVVAVEEMKEEAAA